MNLSDNLRKIRKEHNLSQEQLAEKLGVSRQSVSKWESNQAYPEMDKVVQICNMFNINIDELLNQNINEVKEKKESKNNINKFIDSFLNFITKTVDMFSSMTFKERIKCLFEQVILIIFIILLSLILGSIFSFMLDSFLGMLPIKVYNVIYAILKAIYVLFALSAGIVIVLHIFKTRYLDYYVSTKSSVKEKKNTKEEDNESIENKKEKIIIRDPEHSSYGFISGLLKCLLFLVKLFIIFFGLGLISNFVALVVMLVISFVFVKTGLTFIGAFLCLLGSIVIDLVFLYLIYSFIFNKKCKKGFAAITFIIALLCSAIGIGMFVISLKDFNYIESANTEEQTVIEIDSNDKMFLDSDYKINYVESNNTNIKIVCDHSKYTTCKINNYDGEDRYNIYSYENDANFMDLIRRSIKNINDKKIIDYYKMKITVYTTKENIERIKSNKKNHIETIDNYENRLIELEKSLSKKEETISNLEIQVYEKDKLIEELKSEIKSQNNY